MLPRPGPALLLALAFGLGACGGSSDAPADAAPAGSESERPNPIKGLAEAKAGMNKAAEQRVRMGVTMVRANLGAEGYGSDPTTAVAVEEFPVSAW